MEQKPAVQSLPRWRCCPGAPAELLKALWWSYPHDPQCHIMLFVCGAQLLPQEGAHQLAFGEAVQVEFLVGRMGIVVGQGQAEHEGVGAEAFLEIVDDGDGAAFAQEDRVEAEGGLEGAQGGLGLGAGGRDQVRLGATGD